MMVWMMSLSKREKNPAQEGNLSDELLFDPVTGRKITIEEAEQGVVVESFSPRDAYSDLCQGQ
jgi:hypothetical protein